MARRKILAGLLSALLLAAHMHCVAEHAQEVANAPLHGQRTNAPLGDESPCENKTGCICQGATLASFVAVPAAELDIFAVLDAPPHAVISLFGDTSPAAAWAWRGDHGYVVSARQLRALIETYLL
jgi:hypothetical protein